MSFSIEITGIESVIRSMVEIDRHAVANISKAVEITARHIKDDAKKTAREVLGGSVRHQASTYQYEIYRPSRGIVEAWIGPVKGWKQAAIPLEYGTPYTAPKPVLEPALTGNIPDLVKGISMATGAAL
ncbi:hypothetical protein [Pseudarthrobacter sp. S6]|uniref:hypothetical protein n=1 Tax=Pseudarthrobacter sp. S6 TaxID=3418420 RepID=UPI003CF50B14